MRRILELMWLLSLTCLLLSTGAHAQTPKEAADQIFQSLSSQTAPPKGEWLKKTETQKIMFVKLDAEDAWTMGVLRIMRIGATSERMISVLDDVPGYVGLFKDLLEAKKTPLPSNHEFVVYTETRIPLPLVANDRTSVRYRSQLEFGHRVSSFSLVESNHLAGLEGASQIGRAHV